MGNSFLSSRLVKAEARLLSLTKEYIQARIGISYGHVVYGFIGNKLRIFGEAMNEAARLQDAATPGSVMMSATLHEKLTEELKLFAADGASDVLRAHCTEKVCMLKGLGERVCYHVAIPESDIGTLPVDMLTFK